MAGGKAALIVVGVAGLCLSAAVGVAIADYTVTGFSPVYAQRHPSLADADDASPRNDDASAASVVSQTIPVADRRFVDDDSATAPAITS